MKTPLESARDRTERARAPRLVAQGIAKAVVAGEACTELGCDSEPSASVSWIERWFRAPKAPGGAR
jgi:hypothetical protein